jgi:hypothetical protein
MTAPERSTRRPRTPASPCDEYPLTAGPAGPTVLHNGAEAIYWGPCPHCSPAHIPEPTPDPGEDVLV